MSNKIIYGTEGGGTGNLIKIDLTTGMGTVVGPMGLPSFPSLAFDTTRNIMYAGTGAGNTDLYTVNTDSGETTFVGSTGLGFGAIAGMDFTCDGILFASVNTSGAGSGGGDFLVTIDKNTGIATPIGPFGFIGISGISFDKSGTLWGVLNNVGTIPPIPTPGLYIINTSSGLATFVTEIVDKNGTPLPNVASIQFSCDGTLYGGTSRGPFNPPNSGRLIKIDPSTGIYEFIGSGPATSNGASLGSLSFDKLSSTVCCRGIPFDVISDKKFM